MRSGQMTSLFITFVVFSVFESANFSCVPDIYHCTHGIDYIQANRKDCKRFVHCGMGQATYFQCKKNYVYNFCIQKCIEVISEDEKNECFHAPRNDCVIQKERPYDPNQAESFSSSSGQVVHPESTHLPPPKPAPMSYGYGNGYVASAGMFGVQLTLNYQPFYGWAFNTNLGLQTPWTTVVPFPPFYTSYPFNSNTMTGAPNPWNGYGLESHQHSDTNAVRVDNCVPDDPWPVTTTSATTTSWTLPDNVTEEVSTTLAP